MADKYAIPPDVEAALYAEFRADALQGRINSVFQEIETLEKEQVQIEARLSLADTLNMPDAEKTAARQRIQVIQTTVTDRIARHKALLAQRDGEQAAPPDPIV